MKYKKNRRPRGYLTKENIIKEIKLRSKKGKGLNNKALSKEDSGLITAAHRVFGSWEAAVVEAGFNYQEIQQSQKWTKGKILVSLQELYEQGVLISSNSLKKYYRDIYKACFNHFGGVKEAVSSLGLDYENIKSYSTWNKTKVKNLLINRKKEGGSLSVKSIYQEDQKLYNAAKFYFGTYKNALLECHIDYDDVGERIDWNRKKVLAVLDSKAKNKENLSICKVPITLVNACYRYFGSYEEALREIGLNYEDIREDTEKQRYNGFKFEKLLGELLVSLCLSYTNGHSKEVRPDFVLSNEKWLDAKLSEWSIYNCKTIEKYEPHCRLLTIVYLRGDISRDEMVTSKTRIVSVFNLIKQLPKPERKTFQKRALDLWNEANNIEKLQKETK